MSIGAQLLSLSLLFTHSTSFKGKFPSRPYDLGLASLSSLSRRDTYSSLKVSASFPWHLSHCYKFLMDPRQGDSYREWFGLIFYPGAPKHGRVPWAGTAFTCTGLRARLPLSYPKVSLSPTSTHDKWCGFYCHKFCENLAIILKNFLKIIFESLFPQISTPYHSHHISFSLLLLHLPPQTSYSQTSCYLFFFQSVSLNPSACIFHLAETTLPPQQGREFRVTYCFSCMLLRTSTCPARN